MYPIVAMIFKITYACMDAIGMAALSMTFCKKHLSSKECAQYIWAPVEPQHAKCGGPGRT